MRKSDLHDMELSLRDFQLSAHKGISLYYTRVPETTPAGGSRAAGSIRLESHCSSLSNFLVSTQSSWRGVHYVNLACSEYSVNEEVAIAISGGGGACSLGPQSWGGETFRRCRTTVQHA